MTIVLDGFSQTNLRPCPVSGVKTLLDHASCISPAALPQVYLT